MKKAMKKLLCLVLVLMIAIPFAAFPASAENGAEEIEPLYTVNFVSADTSDLNTVALVGGWDGGIKYTPNGSSATLSNLASNKWANRSAALKGVNLQGSAYTLVFTVEAGDSDEEVGLLLDHQTGFVVNPAKNTFRFTDHRNGGSTFIETTEYDGTGDEKQTYAIEIADQGSGSKNGQPIMDLTTYKLYNLTVDETGKTVWNLACSLSAEQLDPSNFDWGSQGDCDDNLYVRFSIDKPNIILYNQCVEACFSKPSHINNWELSSMQFIHYDYKCSYLASEKALSDNVKRTIFITKDRSELNRDFKYHTTYIRIYTKDSEMERFNLGVDYPPPGSLLTNRCEDRLFLNFVISGKGRFNGEPFSANQFYFSCPLENHTIEADKEDPFVCVWMSIDGFYSQSIIDKLNRIDQERILALKDSADIMKLTELLLYETNLGERSTSYLKTLIDVYIAHVAPKDFAPHQDLITTEKIESLIRQSKSFVRTNLKDVTVATMAEAQHYNPKYFSRIFTEAMGITPQEYITDCRMEWAKNSLIHSSLSLAKIMEAIGYTHRNGFTTAFKKKYGYTPAECRKRAKMSSRASRSNQK